MPREMLLRRQTTSYREARSRTRHERITTSYRLTLELSGGVAVRLDDWLGRTPTERRGHCYCIWALTEQVKQLAGTELSLQLLKPDGMIAETKAAST